MVETRSIEDSKRDERLLVDRLVRRQGLTQDEAVRMVDELRKGRHPQIDPMLMEGLEHI